MSVLSRLTSPVKSLIMLATCKRLVMPIALLQVLALSQAWAQQAAQPGAAAPAAPAAPGWMQFVPLVVIFMIMYFLMIRPQAKRQKTHQQFLAQLKRGDQVVTASGFLGRVEGITEQFVTLEIADGVRVKMLKDRITGSVASATATGAGAEAKA